MKWVLRKKQKKEKKVQQAVEACNKPLENSNLTVSYDENLKQIKDLFVNDELIKYREFCSQDGKRRYCLVYCNGMVDTVTINEHIIKPLQLAESEGEPQEVLDRMLSTLVQACDLKKVSGFSDIIPSVTYGDSLLFTEGAEEGLIIDTKGFTTRAISEPEGEKILTGPREGFNEALLVNLSMIRRKLCTNQLKTKFLTFGKQTNTQACVVYLDNIVNHDILEDLFRRLETIDLDGVLDGNYIAELIRDKAWSPFKSIGETERPDVVVGRMLEGRIAIFLDGTPTVLTLPYLFIENFQSSEDYYLDIYEATFSRMLRMIGFLTAVLVPGIYIAVVAFHHEVMPSSLMVSIAVERANVPLPASLEAFLMLILFFVLREAGLRMPTNVGQAMSIVGALVLGQAAVQAKLVAAPMIIVVAIMGITSLLVPKMTAPIIVSTFGILAFASVLGFLGVLLGSSLLLIHILNLKSFGVSQLTKDRNLQYQKIKDTFIRAPWWQMRDRPTVLTDNVTRQKEKRGEEE